MSSKTILLRWSFVLLVSLLGLIFSLHLSISDNALDLLPEQATNGDIKKLGEMGLVNRLFITLTTKDGYYSSLSEGRQQLKKSVSLLGSALDSSPNFSFVLSHLPKEFQGALLEHVSMYLPYLLEVEDYKKLEEIIRPEGVEKKLQQAFSLLNSPAGIALKQRIQNDPLGFDILGLEKLQSLRSEFTMAIEDGFFVSGDGTSCLLLAESVLSLTDSYQARKIDGELRQAFANNLPEGIEARVIGTLPHTLANADTVQRDLQKLLPAATILLALFLGVTLRSMKAVLVFAVPFLAALPAIGLVSVIYGQLSGVALGFGIVLLGIGVDFAVHLYLSLSEASGTLEERVEQVSRPIFFATLTTSAVFLILHLSSVPSHRQMATLALAGVLLAVCFARILIPTLFRHSKEMNQTASASVQTPQATKKVQVPVIILFLWVALLVAGGFSWPKMEYNGDLRVLDVPSGKVMEDEQRFASTWGSKGEQLFVIVEGELEEALQQNSQVYRELVLNNFKKFQSFSPLLPGTLKQRENFKLWQKFWRDHKFHFIPNFKMSAGRYGFSESAFAPFVNRLLETPAQPSVQRTVTGPLSPLFSSMLKEIDEDNGDSGANTLGGSDNFAGKAHFLAMTTVSAEDGNLAGLQAGLGKLPGVYLIGNSSWRAEVERSLRHDVEFLSALAGLTIAILVAIQFRKLAAVIAVLAPVLSALSAMAIFCFFTGRLLNMMHLIMGIMVIGLSVDYGIFTVCSRLDGANEEIKTSTKAVNICAVSSLVGFGVLAFAEHPALNALGVTVLVGIGLAWPTAVFVSPRLLSILRWGRG